MDILTLLAEITGKKHVLTGADTNRYAHDTTGKYQADPLAVVRPADTEQVCAIVKLANKTKIPIVPVSGNTGLVGGTYADGAILLSLERLNKVHDIRPDARIAIVDAGCIVAALQDAAEADDLIFPLLFGARGSSMIGGALSTNADGSNVLRYGNTRALCLGLEVVTPTGEVMNLMSELHKDNSGYDLKDLFIGAEGTLGIITKAVLKLFPKPNSYATAMVAMPTLKDALILLNRLQSESAGAVEAFEYMPGSYMRQFKAHFPDARLPFEQSYDVNILVELATTSPSMSVSEILENTLGEMMQDGQVLDAVIAQNNSQRAEIWQRRESSAEVVFAISPRVDSDICVAIDKVPEFLELIAPRIHALDPQAHTSCVAHLGDGNLHFSVYPVHEDKQLAGQFIEAIEDVVKTLGGSFSAEHGVGLSKRASMARRKDPVALATMRQIKTALDPNNIMNPGKVLPD
ncbi:FAD-dependent oxidoreductase [Marinosulfonomonas sp. PRT-SC04]|nr:FAD-dependent oxidoreductase [Marinosulfonomonas sp. PRT-SC04]